MATVAIAALVSAACGDGQDTAATGNVAGRSQPTSVPPAPADSPAAQLRAGLTGLLTEHVYLSGIAIGTAVSAGAESAGAEAAMQTLDDNTVALGYAIGSVYGAEAKDGFVRRWRDHVASFSDYATAAAAHDQARASEALQRLAEFPSELSRFVASLNPRLTTEVLEAGLEGHVDTMRQAIDLLVSGDPAALGKLRAAAQHMPAYPAVTLSVAIDDQFPDRFPGAAASSAALLRANLVNLLEEHVYLLGIATEIMVTQGDGSPAAAASAVLEENTEALGAVFGSAYGARVAQRFLSLWRGHIRHVETYARGKIGDDPQLVEDGRRGLNRYRRDFSRFLVSVNGGIKEPTMEKGIRGHVERLVAVVDGFATKDPAAFGRLRDSAQHVRLNLVRPLATATAEKFPEKYSPIA